MDNVLPELELLATIGQGACQEAPMLNYSFTFTFTQDEQIETGIYRTPQ